MDPYCGSISISEGSVPYSSYPFIGSSLGSYSSSQGLAVETIRILRVGNSLSQIKHLLNLITEIQQIIKSKSNPLIENLKSNRGTIVITTIRLKRSSHINGQLLRNSKRIARVGRDSIRCHSKEIPQS